MSKEIPPTLFSDISGPAITPVKFDGKMRGFGMQQTSIAGANGESPRLESFGAGRPTGTVGTLDNQFLVFQLNPAADGNTILDCTEVKPVLEGSDDEPDVLLSAELLSFHLGKNEEIEADTRATLRMNFGKDASSTDKRFDAAFWAVAAGLNLYDQAKNKRADPKELKSDFQQAFSRRPIEIPGGLGRITFDVIKHKEAPWWKRVFGFAESAAGKTLISTLGFPGVTSQAIQMIDQLLEKLDGSAPEVLFQGLPMRLAFSSYARDAFASGISRVKVGCLNRGFAVFARGRDFDIVAKSNAVYVPAYERLVPAEVQPGDLLSGNYDDPLKEVTYAIFRMGTRKTKLDPTFQFG